MSNIEQLELQIQELQRQLKEQRMQTQTLLTKADKAMEELSEYFQNNKIVTI